MMYHYAGSIRLVLTPILTNWSWEEPINKSKVEMKSYIQMIASFIPAHIPKLLVQINYHEEQHSQEGRVFTLWMGFAYFFVGANKIKDQDISTIDNFRGYL